MGRRLVLCIIICSGNMDIDRYFCCLFIFFSRYSLMPRALLSLLRSRCMFSVQVTTSIYKLSEHFFCWTLRTVSRPTEHRGSVVTIPQVPGSNLAPKACYPNSGCSCFPSVPPDKHRVLSFHILTNSPFITTPTIRSYLTYTVEKESLHNQRIHKFQFHTFSLNVTVTSKHNFESFSKEF